MKPFECPPWPPRWPEIDHAVAASLQSGQWGRYHSEICDALQQRLAEWTGCRLVRLCSSGTAALELSLRAARLDAGDEVILAAYDYPGNFRTLELLGLQPVLVDVAEESAVIDASQLEQAASEKTRAVIASHLYGQSADVQRLRQLCDRHGWLLIEDACQVAGMRIRGRLAGTWGDVATLSFGGSKLISAGSGGAILVQHPRLAGRLGALLDRPGEVFPMAPLAAAVTLPQLDRLSEWNAQRAASADFLRQAVGKWPGWTPLASQPSAEVEPAYYKFAWLAESAEHRAKVLAAAQAVGLPIGSGFRSLSSTSDRRCRKPVETPRSDRLAECLCLLDHRALLTPPEQRPQLLAALQRVAEAA